MSAWLLAAALAAVDAARLALDWSAERRARDQARFDQAQVERAWQRVGDGRITAATIGHITITSTPAQPTTPPLAPPPQGPTP